MNGLLLGLGIATVVIAAIWKFADWFENLLDKQDLRSEIDPKMSLEEQVWKLLSTGQALDVLQISQELGLTGTRDIHVVLQDFNKRGILEPFPDRKNKDMKVPADLMPWGLPSY